MCADQTWRFHCPVCGLGDAEAGNLTGPDDVYCVVCLERDDSYVRLQRWEEPMTPACEAALEQSERSSRPATGSSGYSSRSTKNG